MKCILCGKSQWKRLFTARDRMFGIPGTFFEYRCKGCGFVCLRPRLSLKERKKYYPSNTYYSYSSVTNNSIFETIRSYLIRHIGNPSLASRFLEIFIKVPAMPSGTPGRILDVGCGSGNTLHLLRSVGWKCYGLDIDATAISIARKRGIKNASLGSDEDMQKYPDGFFDAIRLYHVIEHVDDPVRCLSLAFRKLKKGGEIIIGTPNVESFVARIAKQYWYGLDCPRHLYLFSPKTLSGLTKQIGFKSPTIGFCSAGGWIGSAQYVVEEVVSKDIDLINRPLLIMLWYPVEWVLDKIGWGDLFILHARR